MRYIFSESGGNHFSQITLADSPYRININTKTSECRSELIQYFNCNFPEIILGKKSREIYRDRCLIGENLTGVQLQQDENGVYQLTVGKDQFLINSNSIKCSDNTPDISAVYGPALILQLALNGFFCFHASAFLYKNHVFVILAESGTGKSTISRHMNKLYPGSRLADDILALGQTDQSLSVFPNFPQLKLAKHKYMRNKVVDKPFLFLFAKKHTRMCQLTPLDRMQGLQRLIGHSVASRLFAPEILNEHLQFCKKAMEMTRCYQLDYLQSQQGLKQLERLLDELV